MSDVLTAQQINDLAAWVDAAQNKDTDAGQRILDALRSHEALRADVEAFDHALAAALKVAWDAMAERDRLREERDQAWIALVNLWAYFFIHPGTIDGDKAREIVGEDFARVLSGESLDAQEGGDEDEKAAAVRALSTWKPPPTPTRNVCMKCGGGGCDWCDAQGGRG